MSPVGIGGSISQMAPPPVFQESLSFGHVSWPGSGLGTTRTPDLASGLGVERDGLPRNRGQR
jgi:hypothetical protein